MRLIVNFAKIQIQASIRVKDRELCNFKDIKKIVYIF